MGAGVDAVDHSAREFADALGGGAVSVVIMEHDFEHSPLSRQSIMTARLKQAGADVTLEPFGDCVPERGRIDVECVRDGYDRALGLRITWHPSKL